jgi:hypothetical protein
MLSLSPFLCTGLTSEYFSLSGNIPMDNDLLHIYVNGEIMKSETVF